MQRQSAQEGGDLTVYYYNASAGSSVTLAVSSILGTVVPNFRLLVKGPVQSDYVDLDLTSPYESVYTLRG